MSFFMAARVQQVKFGKNISTPIDIKTSVPHGSVTSAKFIIFIFDYGSNDFKLVSVLLLMPFLYITDRKIRRICFSTLNAIQLYKKIDARMYSVYVAKTKDFIQRHIDFRGIDFSNDLICHIVVVIPLC